MGVSARRERARLTQVMRAEGESWARIAERMREHYGINARIAFRWAHGWTQDRVAAEWCARWPDDLKTNQNVSSWERWPESGHEPSVRTLIRLARIYECDLSDLVADLGRYRHLDRAHAQPVIDTVTELIRPDVSVGVDADNHQDTDRRAFTNAAVLTALGLADPLRELITAGATSRATVIGREHVQLIETAIENVEARDAALGAGALRAGVGSLHRQVEAWLNDPDYSVHRVEGELQGLLGELSAWAGWLAFDADDHGDATRYLHDALVQARLTDDPQLEVRALTYICLLTRNSRPRESLQCADAALRLARGWATPRLTALLHLRAARAHASLGEASAFSREIAKAKSRLELGTHDDDPLYVQFVTPQEVAGITGLSYLAMDEPERAATEFRSITENPDPGYRRNIGSYTVRLAEATAMRHDIGQASEISLSAVPLVAELGSGRTSRHLRALRVMVDPHRATVPAARDFVDAYHATFGP